MRIVALYEMSEECCKTCYESTTSRIRAEDYNMLKEKNLQILDVRE